MLHLIQNMAHHMKTSVWNTCNYHELCTMDRHVCLFITNSSNWGRGTSEYFGSVWIHIQWHPTTLISQQLQPNMNAHKQHRCHSVPAEKETMFANEMFSVWHMSLASSRVSLPTMQPVRIGSRDPQKCWHVVKRLVFAPHRPSWICRRDFLYCCLCWVVLNWSLSLSCLHHYFIHDRTILFCIVMLQTFKWISFSWITNWVNKLFSLH